MNEPKVIGTCGFGSTGSSVITDYLMEYNNDSFQTLDDIEFSWVSSVDGLIDLENHIMHPHGRTADSIVAIERYVNKLEKIRRYYEIDGKVDFDKFEASVHKFIERITTVSWNWYSKTDTKSRLRRIIDDSVLASRIIPKIEKRVGHQIECYPMKKVRLSVAPECFYTAAVEHVKELLEALGGDLSKTLILDQPFSGNNPQACFPFFENPFAVVVDRDPRDNYVFAKTRLLGRNHFMAVEDVHDFVKYYRALRHNQPYREPNERVLSIQFEELVYDYDKATKKVRDFLQLPENPNPRSVFDPALSVANTQTFKRFPQYAEDIRVIEKELPEYLFDFSKYPEPDLSGKMFFGKSPKHK